MLKTIDATKYTAHYVDIIKLIRVFNLETTAQAKRLLKQGGLRINDRVLTERNNYIMDGDILWVGKRHCYRLKLPKKFITFKMIEPNKDGTYNQAEVLAIKGENE